MMIVSADLSTFSNQHQYRRAAGFPYWTMGLLLKGSTRYTVGDVHAIRHAPFMTLVRPDAPYHVAFEETGESGTVWESGNIIFAPRQSWHAWLDLPSDLPGVSGVSIPDHAEGRLLIQAFRQVLDPQNTQTYLRNQWLENTLETMIILANRFSPDSQKIKWINVSERS
ncbi:MAG: hypothetical protein JKX85_14310 [Phycisphaeraceae bacterium]|nr:hypothetical protein [Phycisphaeraceae bacterium]